MTHFTPVNTDIASSDERPVIDPALPAEGLYPFLRAPDQATDVHFSGVLDYINGLGHGELERRWHRALQMMQEHGAAYNVFNEQDGENRPWSLDPVPLPVRSDVWSDLEKGTGQRIRLMAMVFEDIYGRQELIRGGHLPPELLFANTRYLRACHGLYTLRRHAGAMPAFHFQGMDLAQFEDGRWRVISQDAQAPSGAGYALENRIVLSRILPRMFHSGRVMRLAPFFRSFQHSLMEISGMIQREPSVVMLSPGPTCPTYFEHVFLSRYMGITLVESSDLTVRNESVFIRTLGGLLPVDVIWRFIEDAYCDPLVLGSSSGLGVSGLIQAVRSGNVTVTPPIGSGVLETPGLIPFLSGLCRLLLDEELILQDIPALWCGRSDTMATVLSRIDAADDGLVISSAFNRYGERPTDTRTLGREQKEMLMDRIKALPYGYIAREPLTPGCLPVWEKDGTIARYAALRVFASVMAAEGEAPPEGRLFPPAPEGMDVAVMPGALTRVFETPGALFLPPETDQGSKDTWCFSDHPVSYKSMLHSFTAGNAAVLDGDLPSRVADNMLWLGRYIERIDGRLRVIRSVLSRLNSESTLEEMTELPFLLGLMETLDICALSISSPVSGVNMGVMETALLEHVVTASKTGSIRSALDNVMQVAERVRDRLSSDSWQILGRVETELIRFVPHRTNRISEAEELVNEMMLVISAFSGLVLEGMTQSMGWRFLDMGRRIERAGYMLKLLRSLFSRDRMPLTSELESLLQVADSTITYHTRYRTTLAASHVIDLLLLDELNPRAVGFQMAALAGHVSRLPGKKSDAFRTKEEKTMLNLTSRLRLSEANERMNEKKEAYLQELIDLMAYLEKGMGTLSNQITQHYLTRVETEKQLRHGSLQSGETRRQMSQTGGIRHPGDGI